jgi:hypothetical protein
LIDKTGSCLYFQIKVGDLKAFGSAIPDAAILATDLGAQGFTSLQNLMARAVESFCRTVFKQFLRGFVPGTNLTQ